jgi:protein PhnA
LSSLAKGKNMALETELFARAGGKCEMCETSTEVLQAIMLDVELECEAQDKALAMCEVCAAQFANPETIDAPHWQPLATTMWSEVPAVKIVAWRVLNFLRYEAWAQEALDILYLEEDVLQAAKDGEIIPLQDRDVDAKHLDSFAQELNAGDNVLLTKDLKVKGTSFTAKRGTMVRNISLVPNNPKQIEGRINDQQIVILTEFVKKAS